MDRCNQKYCFRLKNQSYINITACMTFKNSMWVLYFSLLYRLSWGVGYRASDGGLNLLQSQRIPTDMNFHMFYTCSVAWPSARHTLSNNYTASWLVQYAWLRFRKKQSFVWTLPTAHNKQPMILHRKFIPFFFSSPELFLLGHVRACMHWCIG